MTPSAVGCRGWGSGRAGRILTLPGASRAPRSPTPPSQLAPHTSPPPAPRRKRGRREAKLEDDGYSVTISNANVRSERVINQLSKSQQLASRRAHANWPTRDAAAANGRRGCVGASGASTPPGPGHSNHERRSTRSPRVGGRLSDRQSLDLT